MAETQGSKKTGTNAAELTVSELSAAIKRRLEDEFGYVRLRGEISGYRGPHASGHCYFALKDEKAKIEAVIWRGTLQKLKCRPEEGLEVVATGRVTSYPASSKYQIVIEMLEPAGIGALMALIEERKRKLAAEGLFAEERKRPLPFLPRVVGIVTSPTGAVIRDMLHGFTERFPTHVILWPVRVQGETSAAEVAAAIHGFNKLPVGGPIPRPELLIVARGGGSLEDLWSFNEEVVLRAAAASRIPLISAVGHETDWTLLDLVADARAPTPTKAAEWAVPKHSELIADVGTMGVRLATSARRTLETARAHLKAASRGLPRREDLLALPRQRFDAVERRLGRALQANTQGHAKRLARTAPRLQARLVSARLDKAADRLANTMARVGQALERTTGMRRRRFERAAARLSPQVLRQRLPVVQARLGDLGERLPQSAAARLRVARAALDARAQMLNALGYHSVLRRGFAVVRDEAGRAVRAASSLKNDQVLAIEFAEGRATARVTESTPDESAASPRSALARSRTEPPRTTPSGRKGPSGQGSLF